MERVLWNAARRLALLVAAMLAVVAVPFIADARIAPLPAAAGGAAVAFLATALLPLALAARSLRRAARPLDRPARRDA